MNKPYHGYPNYVTWSVRAWMGSDMSKDKKWCDLAEKILKESENTEVAAGKLASEIKGYHEKSKPYLKEVWADILVFGFMEIHWLDIAKSYFEKD